MNLNGIPVTETCGTAVVYADAYLDKAFTQLLDNSVRHGGNVTEIRISLVPLEGGTEIIVEDNGAGIPLDEKERIFDRGVGKNTGWGLFLAREILAVTGISIRECGEPGKGARFVLGIPKDAFNEAGTVTPMTI